MLLIINPLVRQRHIIQTLADKPIPAAAPSDAMVRVLSVLHLLRITLPATAPPARTTPAATRMDTSNAAVLAVLLPSNAPTITLPANSPPHRTCVAKQPLPTPVSMTATITASALHRPHPQMQDVLQVLPPSPVPVLFPPLTQTATTSTRPDTPPSPVQNSTTISSGHETARHGPAPHPHGRHYREWLGGNRPVYVNVFIGHKDIYYVV